MSKKITALLLVLVMTLGCASSMAENIKHERVFAVLDAEGSVQSLTDSIRLENRDGLDTLTDLTMLTEIENAGGKESFTLEDGVLVWDAKGKDITYQGTSDKPLPVTPAVTFTLDGEETTATALAEQSGRMEMKVTYTQTEAVPHLAVSVMLLPAEGVSNVELTNAMLISLSGRQAVIGWAVPGADAALNLPDSFTVSCDADHAHAGWMMTLASADPIEALCGEIDGKIPDELRSVAEEVPALLTALIREEELPEMSGKAGEITRKLAELNTGLTTLNDGAKTLADGAEALNTGLETLSGSSEALNDGADAIFLAILQTANGQIAASGLAEAGLELPELTAENYREVLEGAITKLKALSAFSAQAKEGAGSLAALLEQLNQVSTFTDGVHAYTAGVDQAAAGAKQVSDGALTLHDEGTDTLRTSILTAEKTAAAILLPLMENQGADLVRIFRETMEQARMSGYDLRPEEMKTVTVYILRTDF